MWYGAVGGGIQVDKPEKGRIMGAAVKNIRNFQFFALQRVVKGFGPCTGLQLMELTGLSARKVSIIGLPDSAKKIAVNLTIGSSDTGS